MFLALLVSLICLEVSSSPAKLELTVVKRWDDGSISSNDARCNLCPCWITAGGTGCSLVSGCTKGCGYVDIVGCSECIQWAPLADAFDCIDMDSIPVPKEGWVYWVGAP